MLILLCLCELGVWILWVDGRSWYLYIVLGRYLRILVFNHVAPYRYRLPTVYLFMADIANPDLFCVVVGPGFVPTSPAFMRSSASHPAGPHGRLSKLRAHIPGVGRFRHNLHSSL